MTPKRIRIESTKAGERLGRLLVTILLASTAGCSHQVRPRQPPTATEVGAGFVVDWPIAVTQRPGPLGILLATPQGAVEHPTQITIVFDRPIRPLDGSDEGPVGFSIEPALAGTWSWVGTHGVVFEPVLHEFPRATEYHVRIADELRAVDGSHLGQTWSQRFQTPSPKLALSDCDALTAAPGGAMSVTTEPLVDEADLKRALRVEAASLPDTVRGAVKVELGSAGAGPVGPLASPSEANATYHPLEYTLQRHASRAGEYRILPRQPWPVLSQIRFRIDSGVRSKEGPIPSSVAVERVCRTVGLPYAEASYSRHESRDGSTIDTVYLDFSNPPDPKALMGSIRIIPAARVRVTTKERTSLPEEQQVRVPNSARSLRPSRVEITNLRPSTAYQLTIMPGLTGAFGGRTRYAQRFTITTERAARGVALGIESGQFEPDRLAPIEVTALGIEQFEQAAITLTPEQLFGVIEEDAVASSLLADKLLSSAWKPVRIASPQRENNHSTSVDVRALFEPRLLGGTVLYSARPDRAAPSRPRWLSISDLAITAKCSRYGCMVWVTSLRDAQPRQGVSVFRLNAHGRKELGRTRQDGSLSIQASELSIARSSDPSTQVALLADDGNQWTVLPLEFARTGVTRSKVMDKPDLPLLAVFTDRGVYSGGDSIFIKGYVHRQTDGRSRPARDSRVRVRLLDDSNRAVHPVLSEANLTTNAFGGFWTKFTLPKESPHVAYVVEASVDGARAEAPLVVSEFHPADFEAQAESPAAMVTRQPAPFVIQGRYRSGESMGGGRVEWSTQLEPVEFAPSGSDGYVTSSHALFDPLGSARASSTSEPIPLSQGGLLGEDGRREVPVSVDHELTRPHRLRFRAKILGVAQNTATAEAETIVHPAAYYLGLRSESMPVVGRPFVVGVRAFDLEGRAIGARPVDVLLLPQKTTVGSPSGRPAVGAAPLISSMPVSRCRLTTAKTDRSCNLSTSEPGVHVVHAVSVDELGRKAQAAMTVFARESSTATEPVPSAPFGRETVKRPGASDVAEIMLDRPAYHRGDQARLYVHSPFPRARAIVTLEGASVYFSASRQVGRTSEFEIPVPESIEAGAYANVVLLREPGRVTAQIANPDSKERVVAQKAVPLSLAADDRRIQVEVKPQKTELLPGGSLVCDVTVRNRLGRSQSAEVTLWAVEELGPPRSAIQMPDLLGTFAAPRELSTSTYDSRVGLGWLPKSGYRELEPSVGVLGPIPAASKPPTQRRSSPWLEPERGVSTVVFLPELLTDAQGHARVEFKLPTHPGRFRIRAQVATAEGEFGTGETSFSTGAPLATRTQSPRFARVGDHFRAGLVLATQPELSGEASIRVYVDGIDLLESSQRTVALLPGRSREVLFDFKSRTPGTAKIRFELAANGGHRTVQLGVPVLFQQPRQTLAFFGETQRARAERMPRLPPLSEAQTQLEVSLSRTPLVGLAQSIEAVLERGPENTEQLASQLLILGALRDFSLSAGAKLPPNANQEIQRLLTELTRRQVPVDGYAYQRGGPASRWLSNYVNWVLARTAAAKVPLHPELQFEPKHYLQSMGRSMQPSTSRADGLEERVFALEILTELLPMEREVGNAIDEVLPKRDRLPLFSQAQLLRAVTLQKPQRPHWAEARASLLTKIVSKLRVIGGRADLEDSFSEHPALLDAKDRTLAFVLRALVAQPSQHVMTPAVLRGLVASRKTETWSSTQAAAFALMAIAEYQATVIRDPASSEGTVWSGNQPLLSVSLGAQHWQASSAVGWRERLGQQPLVFEHRGNGTLFYTARLHYVPASMPRAMSSAGLELTHSMAAAHDGDAVFVERPVASELHLCLGDFVHGEVQVFSSRTRHHVTVEVPLPAGLEAVHASESWPGHGSDSSAMPHPFERPYQTRIEQDRVRFYIEVMEPGQLQLRYSARATILGSFALPPARVEEQYNPDHFATTPASRVIITPR